jgi:hypothetical protein
MSNAEGMKGGLLQVSAGLVGSASRTTGRGRRQVSESDFCVSTVIAFSCWPAGQEKCGCVLTGALHLGLKYHDPKPAH